MESLFLEVKAFAKLFTLFDRTGEFILLGEQYRTSAVEIKFEWIIASWNPTKEGSVWGVGYGIFSVSTS